MSLPATSSYNRVSAKPTWLEAELAETKRLIPDVNLQVMFGDELPHTDEMLVLLERAVRNNNALERTERDRLYDIYEARHTGLQQTLAERFDDPALGKKFADAAVSHDSRLAHGLCTSTAQFARHAITDVSGEVELVSITASPTHAFILLVPACFDSVSSLAFTANLNVADCLHNSPHQMQLPDYVHERGHLEIMMAGQTVTPWVDEFQADGATTDRMWELGRPDLATRQLLYRTATNFIGGAQPSDSAYWSALSQAGHLPGTSEAILRDKSATLELKRRAARWLKDVDGMSRMRGTELKQLNTMLRSRHHAGLRDLYSPYQPNAMLERKVLMHALDRVVEQDVYTYPETRALAHLTRHALHAYFPSVLADKAYYAPHLKTNAPAP